VVDVNVREPLKRVSRFPDCPADEAFSVSRLRRMPNLSRSPNRFTGLVLAGLICLSLVLPAYARNRKEHWGEGFSVDLNKPYEQVIGIVRAVSEDGIVRGTYDFRGVSELDGATPAKDSKAFSAWTGGGTVLYKVRPKTLSPEHFRETNDEGTITVRYVVQSLGPASTRLRIDAVFKEDTGHHTDPSDGSVEQGEFEAISVRIRDLEDTEEKHRQESERSEIQSKLQGLEAELEKENSQLAELKAREEQLHKQIQSGKSGAEAQVRTESADLKARPYNQSKTLQLLAQGEIVTVLRTGANWCHVVTASGQEGWVYRPMLQTGLEASQ